MRLPLSPPFCKLMLSLSRRIKACCRRILFVCRVVLAGETVSAGHLVPKPGKKTTPSSAPSETPRRRGGFRTAVQTSLQRGMSDHELFQLAISKSLGLSEPWKGLPEALVIVAGACLLFLVSLYVCAHKRWC